MSVDGFTYTSTQYIKITGIINLCAIDSIAGARECEPRELSCTMHRPPYREHAW